ncbi:TonB-dependent receptor [Cesiribacter sp. SM1]|uniref:SusC/RagA family TonB-linked outer membrane protein n=1 Tax=Cesiribacter sp. SM1 TaxID=2861196 RepID=UPI001CD20CC6|nr:TonB-dependent receptor [Cesiribacter sp. SM1]
MRKILLVLLLLGCVLWQPVLAQERRITGAVRDASSGEALPGVSILIDGTSTGTVTDMNGTYALSAAPNATLVFSFIGYLEQRVPVNNRSVIDVQLREDVEQLSEIVVVGYGTQEKKDATGAVTSISSKEFNQGVISSPEQLIQGKSAGIQVTESSGEPGAGMTIRIRGTSSIRSGNNPLYVIDGVPLSGSEAMSAGTDVGFGTSSARNPLTFINPNDIENVSVLKDASATAIYGSRGANGVILITTKRGQGENETLEVNSSISTSRITRRFDLLGREAFLDGAEALGGDREALDLGGNTDWQDEILRTAITHNHYIAYSDRSDAGSYRLSLGYMDQEGIVNESGLKRITGRINANRRFLNDRITLSTQLTLANVRDQNVPITNNSGFRGDLLGAMIIANPTRPVRNADGTFNQPGVDQLNPVAMLAYNDDYTNTIRALASFGIDVKIYKDLSFRTSLGFDQSTSNRKAAYSGDLVAAGIQDVGRGGYLDVRENNLLVENYFTYNRELNSNNNLEFLLGYAYQRFDYETQTVLTRDYRTRDLNIMINNSASANQFLVNTANRVDELQSVFGRFNLKLFSDKFLVTGTVRADGSTKFGENNKYGVFPSGAVAWRISDEAFVPDAFSDLKLRVGYGITGNQEIPNNLVYPRQRYSDYSFAENGDINGGDLGDVAFANPNLRWESTAQFNAGLDYGFFSNRLRGSLDYYYKTTYDLLIQQVAAQPAAQPFVWTNLDADIINQGVELNLEANIINTTAFSWDINGNVGYNRNKVVNYTSITNTGEITGQGLTGAYAQRIANNQPLYAYYLRDFTGYDSEGNATYNGGDVQQFTGDTPLPKVTAGLTNNFRYKNFDLGFFFNGMFGHKIYNNTANAFFTSGSLVVGRNVTADVVGNGESPLNAADVSTRFLESGNFVRLQNATLGYTLPVGTIRNISNVRIFITGQNLLLFTNYTGLDPEVNISKAIDGIPSAGIDYTAYPKARTFTFGLSVAL